MPSPSEKVCQATAGLAAEGLQKGGKALAAGGFPSTVRCDTAYAKAYAALGHRYARRLSSPRQPAWKIGAALRITRPVRIEKRDLTRRTLSRAVA